MYDNEQRYILNFKVQLSWGVVEDNQIILYILLAHYKTTYIF